MPGATPRTLISAQFLWRIGSRNPVCRGRQRFTFGSVFPFPADRTFRFVVHHEPFRRFLVNLLEPNFSAPRLAGHEDSRGQRRHNHGAALRVERGVEDHDDMLVPSEVGAIEIAGVRRSVTKSVTVHEA